MGASCSANNHFDEFVDCCLSGELSTIRDLMETESVKDVNEGDETGLAISCRENHYQIVLFLLRQDSLDVNKGITEVVSSVSDSGEKHVFVRHTTPLFIACQKNFPNIVKLLITSGRNININDGVSLRDMNGRVIGNHRSPLTVAAEKRYYGIVRMLLEKPEVDPSMNDIYKVLQSASTLYYLCRDETEDSIEVLDILLKFRGFRPRRNSMNPLFPAVENGHKEVVKRLLEFKPISLFINKGLKGGHWGKTPLYLSLEKGHVEITKMLIDFKDTNLNGHKNYRPLHFCCEKGLRKLARRILKTGRVDYNIKSAKTGSTPLHIAVKKNNVSLVKLLLSKDLIDQSLRSMDKEGNTPEEVIRRNKEIKKAFKKYEEEEGESESDESEN